MFIEVENKLTKERLIINSDYVKFVKITDENHILIITMSNDEVIEVIDKYYVVLNMLKVSENRSNRHVGEFPRHK